MNMKTVKHSHSSVPLTLILEVPVQKKSLWVEQGDHIKKTSLTAIFLKKRKKSQKIPY